MARSLVAQALVALAAVLTFAVPARADDVERRAYEAFDAKRYDAALKLFRRAFDRGGKPDNLRNVAGCYYFLGRDQEVRLLYPQADRLYRLAAQELDRYMRLPGLAASDVASARVRLEEFRGRFMGRLRVQGAAGIQVTLNGRLIGRLPVSRQYVPPGKVTVILAPPGATAVAHEVVLAPDAEIAVDADALIAGATGGVLLVEGLRPGDVVELDGAAVSGARHRLPAGTHRLVVRRSGFASFAVAVPVAAGETRTVAVTPGEALRPAWKKPWPWVTLGIGVACGFTGMGFTLAANALDDEKATLAARGDVANAELKRQDAVLNDQIAYAFYGVGGAALITSIVLFLTLDDKDAATAWTPRVAPTDGGLVMGAGFSF